MANCTIYTRVYSGLSPRQLASGKGATGPPLTHEELLAEFDTHKIEDNKQATALVSVSGRIVDTISRALTMPRKPRGPHPKDVWIAFIEVPNAENKHRKTSTRTHRAEDLAKERKLPESKKFRYEIVFEWAIPEEWVTHQVSLQTLINRWGGGGLMDRVLDFVDSLPDSKAPSTQMVKGVLAEQLKPLDPRDLGAELAYLARAFGARAPSDWIARQVFYDCVGYKTHYSQKHWFALWFAEKESKKQAFTEKEFTEKEFTEKEFTEKEFTEKEFTEKEFTEKELNKKEFVIRDAEYFLALEQGIEDTLDGWLTGTEFVSACENYKKWRCVMDDRMEWDVADFGEKWKNLEGGVFYKEALKKLFAEHEAIERGIEQDALEIGL